MKEGNLIKELLTWRTEFYQINASPVYIDIFSKYFTLPFSNSKFQILISVDIMSIKERPSILQIQFDTFYEIQK